MWANHLQPAGVYHTAARKAHSCRFPPRLALIISFSPWTGR